MGLCVSTTSRIRSTRRIDQNSIENRTSGNFRSTERISHGTLGGESQRQSPLAASIHILDDDSLLNVFYLYRPSDLGEGDEEEGIRLLGGNERWVRGRWWYNLAHVCQRWRNIILGSASYLGVSLVCTNGTPVADMLEHSPPLPLVIDYQLYDDDIAAEDEEGAIIALKQYDRVRRVRLLMLGTGLQKFIAAMDDEYLILEYLIIVQPDQDKSSVLVVPETLQAPHLRHLALDGFTLPVRSRFITTAVGLVTLYLFMFHPSTYFHPNTLLLWLSSIPQLETLEFGFLFPIPNRDIERQLTHTPIMTAAALPNLHHFIFCGVGTYLEAVIHRITTPRLEKLQISIFNQLTFSVPRLLQFVNTSENFAFKRAKFEFADNKVGVEVYPHEEAKTSALSIAVNSSHLDWQVSSAAQISDSLSPTFSAVDRLTLEHSVHTQSSEEHNQADPIDWRKLLGSFRNVKTLCIAEGLVEELSHCLGLGDGERSLELLPKLQKIKFFGSGSTTTLFIGAPSPEYAGPTTLNRIRHSSPTFSVLHAPLNPLQSFGFNPVSSDTGSDLDITYAGHWQRDDYLSLN